MIARGRRRALVAAAVTVVGGLTAAAALAAQYSLPLQAIGWENALLPGSVCRYGKPIQLHNHAATLARTAFGNVDSAGSDPDLVEVSAAYNVSFGQLSGAGPSAAVDVLCSNNGGTADGQIRSVDAIFSGTVQHLRTLGVITPQVRGARDNHVPLLGKPKFSAGRIVVQEYFYGPVDPTCCATGRATTTWRYSGGKLKALRTVVTRHPAA